MMRHGPLRAAQFGSESQALLLADISPASDIGRTPMMLGFLSYLQRHLTAGFFLPISRSPAEPGQSDIDRHVELMIKACNLPDEPEKMIGVREEEAHKLVAEGNITELMDMIYSAFAKYKDTKQVSLLPGPGLFMGDSELDAIIAAALSTPVILTMNVHAQMSVAECYNHVMMKRQLFLDHKAPVLGVALNRVPRATHAVFIQQLREMLEGSGVPFAGGVPDDPLLGKCRLDEIVTYLGANVLFGENSMIDKECAEIIVASQRVEELLEMLEEKRGSLPLIVTSMDRLDIVLGLLASQLSIKGPAVAGVLLTRAGSKTDDRRYARETVARIFQGLEANALYKGSLPIFQVDLPMYEVMNLLHDIKPCILVTSAQKIRQSKALFDRYIDADALFANLQSQKTIGPPRVTPQLFQYNIKAACLSNPQRIVLPESEDKRVLQAAAEVTQRGLAHITLLGDPETVQDEATKLGIDISLCDIVNPQEMTEQFNTYVDALVEARKKKGLPRDVAIDTVRGDVNMFGVLMVHCGDADGMVSGATHTTAATVRPAMQVLRNEALRVSSVFFMCLPDRVLVYGDCAVNMNPSSEDLAQIAIVSADTARAFGVDPRVAMLSYSTLGSGDGPDVQKVIDAVAMVKKTRPNMKVEGPIQYDAAIDPVVAAVKVKTDSEVAGKATVFIFPDLNTGNNTYKAVQQATGAVAMGPVMQGLLKPVNDLSRGCTVADIVNTICVTSVQAMQTKGEGTVELETEEALAHAELAEEEPAEGAANHIVAGRPGAAQPATSAV